MSYNRDLESDRDLKRANDAMLKKLSAERLARNRAWKQAHKAR